MGIESIILPEGCMLKPIKYDGFHEEPGGGRKQKVLCLCECGNTISTLLYSLVSGKAKSCGCSRAKSIRAKFFKSAETINSSLPADSLLTVLDVFYDNNRLTADCVCACGNKTKAEVKAILSGRIKRCFRCGILSSSKKNKKFKNNNIYIGQRYHDMIYRCYNKKCRNYKNYGKRGISVCEEWRNDYQSFIDWCHANGFRRDLHLDRIEVNGNYEPSNCRFIPRKKSANNRTNNVFYEINGIRLTVAEWSERLQIDRNKFSYYIGKKELSFSQMLSSLNIDIKSIV